MSRTMERLTQIKKSLKSRSKVIVVCAAPMDDSDKPREVLSVVGGTKAAREAVRKRLAAEAQPHQFSDVSPAPSPSYKRQLGESADPHPVKVPGRWAVCSRCRSPFEVMWNDSRQRCPCGGSAR